MVSDQSRISLADLDQSACYCRMVSDLCFRNARELVHLIQTRQLSPKELVDAHLRQIERWNPKVNAIVTFAPLHPPSPGPLHGLPIAHKDLFDTAGIRTTYGSPLFRDHVPTINDPVVTRLQQAGAVTIGKTNTPEFGAGSQTFNPIFGATRNPYDLSKTCGGSSGGSAVALACGMMPIADGSDLGGSLRNPAAFCNIVGFRPTLGLIHDPLAPPGALSTPGPMARSVSDVALLLGVLASPEFDRPLDRDVRGLRIAWWKTLGGIPFDPQIRAIVNARRSIFEDLGCTVEPAEPDFSGVDSAFRILRAHASAEKHVHLYRRQPAAFKETLREEIETGLRLSPADLARAIGVRDQFQHRFREFLQPYDAFILPTTQVPPFNVDVEYPRAIDGVPMHNYIDWMKSCWYISMTGAPAISVPAGFTPEGLPVGLQIVGRPHDDFAVLQLAYAYEKTTSNDHRRALSHLQQESRS